MRIHIATETVASAAAKAIATAIDPRVVGETHYCHDGCLGLVTARAKAAAVRLVEAWSVALAETRRARIAWTAAVDSAHSNRATWTAAAEAVPVAVRRTARAIGAAARAAAEAEELAIEVEATVAEAATEAAWTPRKVSRVKAEAVMARKYMHEAVLAARSAASAIEAEARAIEAEAGTCQRAPRPL